MIAPTPWAEPDRAPSPETTDTLTSEWSDLLSEARDLLRSRLRPPEGVIPFRWSASDLGPSVFDLNDLLPLVTAWSGQDPPVACDLVRAALSAQADDGSLPRALDTYGVAVLEGAPWPTLCMAGEIAARAKPHAAYSEDVVPHLTRYLAWALSYFDPDQSGRPRWRRAEESPIPEAWDPDVLSADLAALLLAEIDALERLNADTVSAEPIAFHRKRLQEALADFFWDPESRIHRDRLPDGRFIRRVTWSAVVPTICRDRSETLEGALALIRPGGALDRKGGVALWEPWPDDPVQPAAPVLHEAVLFAGWWLADHSDVLALVGPRLRGALLSARERGHPFPRDLTAIGDGGPSVAAAALALMIEDLQPLRHREEAAPHATRVRRVVRPWAVSAGLGLVLATVVIVGVWWWQRRPPPGPSIEALIGLAQNHYRQGDFEDALSLCREIVNTWGAGTAAGVRFLYANTLFRLGRYEEAAEQYRLALTHPDIGPLARYNLAQTAIRLGREDDALHELDQLAEEIREDLPELAKRAQQTANFLRQRRASLRSDP